MVLCEQRPIKQVTTLPAFSFRMRIANLVSRRYARKVYVGGFLFFFLFLARDKQCKLRGFCLSSRRRPRIALTFADLAATSKLAGLTAIRDKALLVFCFVFFLVFLLSSLVDLEDVCAYVVTEN